MTGLWDSPSVPDPAAGPRGRGNPNADMSEPYYWRPIPAWAGEPKPRPASARRSRVYPRVGGGTVILIESSLAATGLSPRGRGNRRHRRHCFGHGGSIPAWAGEPHFDEGQEVRDKVYPRVGGGTPTPICPSLITGGLSPRGRGNPSPVLHPLDGPGSIPAWAGEPSS